MDSQDSFLNFQFFIFFLEGVVSFQVNSPNSDNFTELCGGVGDYCMMSLGALTGLVKSSQTSLFFFFFSFWNLI